MNRKERERLIHATETYLPLEYRQQIIEALRNIGPRDKPRCTITGNPCGTDTWASDRPPDCHCGRNHAVLISAQRELAALRERLEISDEHGYDGIACRDETIKQQDGIIDALRAQLAMWKEGEELMTRNAWAWKDRAERAEAQLAERDAEIKALKGHADALEDAAQWLRDNFSKTNPYRKRTEDWANFESAVSEQFDMADAAIDAYRRAFPKE